MYNFIDFTNKKIIVAGASSGIGRQTAITLSRLGATVILMARREDKLKEVLLELEGSEHSYYCADFSEVDKLDLIFKTIATEHGAIDGLVYSAGTTSLLPLKAFSPNQLDNLFKVNFYGFIESVRQLTKKGRFNSGFRVVGVSSVSSLIGKKADMGYSATKGAMNSAVRSLAKELADKEICINAVAPGMINTEMYQQYLEANGEDSIVNQTLLKRQYLGIGETTDVANAIAFLLSPAARFITGLVLPVDGGHTEN